MRASTEGGGAWRCHMAHGVGRYGSCSNEPNVRPPPPRPIPACVHLHLASGITLFFPHRVLLCAMVSPLSTHLAPLADRPQMGRTEHSMHILFLRVPSGLSCGRADGAFFTQLEPLGKRRGTIPQWGGEEVWMQYFTGSPRGPTRDATFSRQVVNLGLQGTDYFHLLSGPPHIPEDT